MSKLTDFLPKFAPLDGVGTRSTWPIGITGGAATVTDGVYLNAVQTVSNKTFTKPVVEGLIEMAIAVPANTITVDLGNVFTKTITAATTLSVTGAPPAGKVASFILKLTNGGAHVVTWWTTVNWAGGVPPTLTVDGTDNLGFYTHDGGATWEGFLLSQDSKFATA